MANGIERGGRLMIQGKISNLGTSGSLGAWVRGESMNPSCTYMARTGCGRMEDVTIWILMLLYTTLSSLTGRCMEVDGYYPT